ncbi:MAG: right-handed parallel beta-helix repeat-containing protein [Armatimonadetes bacterium]|nr:right-handed parallel beta-helix repeat-containing protein [Armatimonadota bacterium]
MQREFTVAPVLLASNLPDERGDGVVRPTRGALLAVLISGLSTVALLVAACDEEQTTTTAVAPTTSTQVVTTIPARITRVVTDAADSGPGTFRQALEDAQPGDTIIFEPEVFPPDAPTTILPAGELPLIDKGGLTIDASSAGVILDGSDAGEGLHGLYINSNDNVVRGLQIVSWGAEGIILAEGANHNTIGGDRGVGSGPLGQGNLCSGNKTGVAIEGVSSFNTIQGNLIGVDGSGVGDYGNLDTGILVQGGAGNNIIGPDNVIAHNLVGIGGQTPSCNTITKNSIYDNDHMGIFLADPDAPWAAMWDQLLGYVHPPTIVGFDLSRGTATVLTGSGWTVEVFSDSGNQGRVLEAQGTADDTGTFVCEKGGAFAGPHLTATATDPYGTSAFSLATTGDACMLPQTANPYPTVELLSRPSGQLADTKIGSDIGSLWYLSPALFPENRLDPNRMLAMGLKHVRFAINCMEVVGVHWGKPEFSIDPSHDQFITEMANNGVELTYCLSFWDTDYRMQGGTVPDQRFHGGEGVERYLDYVRFIVRHFKDRVACYELWNEPNLKDSMQAIDVDDYIELVRQAVPVIREEFPGAKIKVGSVAGGRDVAEPEGPAYLLKILESDIMPDVDVVTWHMRIGYSPDDWRGEVRDEASYYAYPGLIEEIKETASAHGFEGEYEVDEVHWPTARSPEEPYTHYSDLQSVKYLTRSIMMHRGLDMIVLQGLPPSTVLWRTTEYLSTVMSGVEPTDLPAQVESTAVHIAQYGFLLPNGDRMLALWNDNVAVDYDAGVPSTLTLPACAGCQATAIDVLNGFSQTLVTSSEGGGLVIRDFLLKDYPIMIQLSQ